MGYRLVFDVEADHLLKDVTKLHCISTWDLDTGEKRRYSVLGDTHGTITDGLVYLEGASVIVGHNICSYDVCAIEKLYPSFVAPKRIDTLLLSALLLPELGILSLENWAQKLNLKTQKVQNEDWSTYTPNMGARCDSDVDINVSVFRYLLNQRGCDKVLTSALRLEQEVAEIHALQAVHGVKFDVLKAIDLLHELDERLEKRREVLMSQGPSEIRIPGVPIIRQGAERASRLADVEAGRIPKGMSAAFKKDGNYTKATEAYFGAEVKTVKGFYTKITHKPFNPDSKDEVKALLLSLGWIPTEWNFKKDPNGGLLKDSGGSLIPTSPKLTEDSYGSLPPGLGQAVAEYNMMTHRRQFIMNKKDVTKGALARVKERGDGRISAEAFTCGTPTSRYRHQGSVCNIPRPSSPYGKEIRSLFTVEAGAVQVGVDLSGIEARCLAWYLLNGGFKDAQKTADLILSPDKGNDFHSYNAKQWNVSRDTAKSGLYALLYGAGAKKLANTLGKPESQGAKLKKAFYLAHPGIEQLIDELESALSRNGGFVNAIDGRPIFIRSNNRLLNSLLQTTAAIVFKQWMVNVHEEIEKDATLRGCVHQIVAYHDELQFEVKGLDGDHTVDIAERLMEMVESIAVETGKALGAPVPIEAVASMGLNWSDTH